jgi:hypothetical protein
VEGNIQDRAEMVTTASSAISRRSAFTTAAMLGLGAAGLAGGVGPLATHQFQPAAQSGGIGRPNWSSLTMRRIPRVSQDNLLRFRFVG